MVLSSTLVQTDIFGSEVLPTALDLVDLSEPGGSSGRSNKDHRRSPLRKKGSSKSPRRRARPDETELIQVEVEHLPGSPRTPERMDSGDLIWLQF